MLLVILIFTLVDTISQSVLPVPDHIVAVILENHSYSQIIGSSEAVYINALASDSNSALFINSYAIEHPSQPKLSGFVFRLQPGSGPIMMCH